MPFCPNAEARLSLNTHDFNVHAEAATKSHFHELNPDEKEILRENTEMFSKRGRTWSDEDCEEVLSTSIKKKRRLDLDQVTARHSRPFAGPMAHYKTRKQSRTGVWARQKFQNTDWLRKQALLNSLRKRGHELRELDRAAFELVERCHRNHFRFLGKEQQNYTIPSPLGLSNYEAFDAEDDMLRESEETEPLRIYSDFNFMDPSAQISQSSIWDNEINLLEEKQGDPNRSLYDSKNMERPTPVPSLHFI